jgi:hypothetical protein
MSKARADFLAKHGELGKALLEETGNDVLQAKRLMYEGYQDVYLDEEEFVRWYVNIPHKYQGHFDYQACWRQMFEEEFFSLNVGDEVHVFMANDEKARAMFVAAHGEALAQRVLAHVDDNLEEAQRLMRHCYCGAYSSQEAFAICQSCEKYFSFSIEANGLTHLFGK